MFAKETLASLIKLEKILKIKNFFFIITLHKSKYFILLFEKNYFQKN